MKLYRATGTRSLSPHIGTREARVGITKTPHPAKVAA